MAAGIEAFGVDCQDNILFTFVYECPVLNEICSDMPVGVLCFKTYFYRRLYNDRKFLIRVHGLIDKMHLFDSCDSDSCCSVVKEYLISIYS